MARKMYYLLTLLGLTLLFMIGCIEGDPELKLEPNELDFGTEATQKEFTIQNVGYESGIFRSGAKTLKYDIATNDNWISSSPTSGESDGEKDNITVTIDRTSLIIGNNTGEIDIFSNGGNATINIKAEKKGTVTGRWQNNFSVSGTPFTAYTQLTQNGTTLTGTYEMSDGSGYQNIGSGSYIYGKSIKISFLIGSYNSYFDGTVSDNFQSMSGDLYVQGVYIGPWSATKTGLPKATDSPYDVPVVEKLHELIEKLK